MVAARSRLTLAIVFLFVYFGRLGDAAAISPTRAWSWYKTMLKQHPLMTKSTTSSAIMTVSDVICQQITKERPTRKNEKAPSMDYLRVLHVAITGFIWSGPVSHHWYAILEKIVKIEHPIGGLATRIFLDAMIFSPVAVSGYFSVRSILEGSNVKGIRHKLSTKFVPTVVGAWKFWPAANIVNFGMVPIQFRVLYNNVLSLFWTGYLTHVNAKARQMAVKTP